MTVRITSYNLLVPLLANRPEHYCNCQPEFLKTDYRWKLIQTQLEQEIADHKNTIICLQEVSFTLLSKLKLFFHRLNYSFFHHLYGDKGLDYMGVGIAVPVSIQLNDISFIKIGDHIHSNLLTAGLAHHSLDLNEWIQLTSDPWNTAIDTDNTLICLQLIVDGKPLCVGTYHMPCFYKEPDVMAIHSSVVKDLMFQLAAGQNMILAGDFNFKPCDACYRALTENGYIDAHFPKQSNTYDISYQPKVEQALKSAYREKNGSEPVYTDFSDTRHSPNFCATLDYIFFAGQLVVENVLELPDHPTGKSYPDETHPSDHLMIAATFRLS